MREGGARRVARLEVVPGYLRARRRTATGLPSRRGAARDVARSGVSAGRRCAYRRSQQAFRLGLAYTARGYRARVYLGRWMAVSARCERHARDLHVRAHMRRASARTSPRYCSRSERIGIRPSPLRTLGPHRGASRRGKCMGSGRRSRAHSELLRQRRASRFARCYRAARRPSFVAAPAARARAVIRRPRRRGRCWSVWGARLRRR